jgi:hypothetical protein
MDRTKLEAIATQAIREVGFSFRIMSILLDAGTWEIWFSGVVSPTFSVKIQDADLSHDGLVRSTIKLELLKHAVSTKSQRAAS